MLPNHRTPNAVPTSAATRASASTTAARDRKSTRLNSSHSQISYAVFCLKKKNQSRARAAGDTFWPQPALLVLFDLLAGVFGSDFQKVNLALCVFYVLVSLSIDLVSVRS